MDSGEMLAELRISETLFRNHLKVNTEGTKHHILLDE